MSGLFIPKMELPSEEYGKMVVTIYPNGSTVEYVGDVGRDFGIATPCNDVRPVVLCRDCTFFKPQQKSKRWSSTTPMCSRSATIKMPPDGFCSFGVKREES